MQTDEALADGGQSAERERRENAAGERREGDDDRERDHGGEKR